MPSYDDIDAAIDLIGATFNRYFPLFTAAAMHRLTPVFQDDWLAVFRVPWMPTGDA
jgi:hypothetical protein